MHIVREGFFAYLEDVAAPGDGFALLGRTHLLVLAGLGLVIALLCFVYTQLIYIERPAMIKAIAVTSLVMEIIKQATFPFLHGGYRYTQLPLHLCGISIFMQLVYAWYSDTGAGKTAGEILYSLCLPGGVAALVFANWSMYPLTNYYCLHSFIIHTLQIAFPLMLVLTGELVPHVGNLWRPALFLLIIVPPIYFLNTKLNTNFFFVNAGSPGSPLEALIRVFGTPWFIFPYIALLLLVWACMYAPWVMAERHRQSQKVRIYRR